MANTATPTPVPVRVEHPRPTMRGPVTGIIAILIGLMAALVPLVASPASASPTPTGIIVHNGTPPPQVCVDLLGEIAGVIQQEAALGSSIDDGLMRLYLFVQLSSLLDQYDTLNCDQYSGMPKLG